MRRFLLSAAIAAAMIQPAATMDAIRRALRTVAPDVTRAFFC
jgi:hydroxymethylpyrimidine/phosphomethylpyrimidine kinase